MGFNSVERVEEYLNKPQEPPASIDSTKPHPSWPSAKGSQKRDFLIVKDLRVRYAADLPDVLQGLSFALKPRERLAVVGRTGSGKSTLAMSLLRFAEPSGGSITLDGWVSDFNSLLSSRLILVHRLSASTSQQLALRTCVSASTISLRIPCSFPVRSDPAWIHLKNTRMRCSRRLSRRLSSRLQPGKVNASRSIVRL